LNRKVLIAGLVIVVPFIVLLVMNLGRNPHKVDSPLVGKPAPPFALRAVGGTEVVDVGALKGKPVVVNFWATWCVPCYAEHGVLVSSARSLGSKVQFVGVVYDDTEPKILQFLQQYGSAYPTLLDDAGKTAIAYGVYGVPETFFIDPQGTIVAKYEGALNQQSLFENLRKAGLQQ
jgi:cytochrome c biogenesis protein CcmG, thiol:disulfide interchange protein DsbE